MNCDEIRELLLTDYVDGELDAARKAEVRGHLQGCAACRRFERAVRETAIEPLKNAEKVQPPDAVWERIRQAVIAGKDRRAKGAFTVWRERLEAAFPARARIPSLAAAAVILLAVAFTGVSFNRQRIASRDLNKQWEVLTFLETDVLEFSNGDDATLGTAVEEFLL